MDLFIHVGEKCIILAEQKPETRKLEVFLSAYYSQAFEIIYSWLFSVILDLPKISKFVFG